MTTPGKVERNRGMQQRRPEEMGRLRRMGRPNRSRTRALARPRVSRRRQQRLRWLLPLRLRRLARRVPEARFWASEPFLRTLHPLLERRFLLSWIEHLEALSY